MREITAPRNFSPGEVVFEGKPFIEILSREFKDVACGSCFERASNLEYCKDCLNVKYCGKSCQSKDWEYHKQECQNLKNLPSDDIEGADVTRLLGSAILMIKGKDWKTIKSNSWGMDITFDEIESSLESTSSTYRHIFVSSIKEYTRKYIGDENMPNEDEFMQIYGKVFNSKFRTGSCELRSHTVGLIWGFIFERKCIPNCCVIQTKDGFKIKAIKKIEKSEKLFFNKNSLKGAETAMPSPCSCTECRLPYGESVLTKITDARKAYNVIFETKQFINMWRCFPGVQSIPVVKYTVDNLLQKHEGVLGNTNMLHLKLLTIKCFDIESNPLERMRNLLKLEKNIVETFGEYYTELADVYQALSDILLSMGNIIEGTNYLRKAIFVLE